MKITVIGCGYVGLVTGACLAYLGESVTCLDVDIKKIDSLKKGYMPFYEPQLEDIVDKCLELGQLKFTDNIAEAIKDSKLIFVAVNTPTNVDSSVDLTDLLNVLRSISLEMEEYKALVIKSTVPVGTCRNLYSIFKSYLKNQGKEFSFDIISNPEFLREGSAIYDFMNPDRLVIGVDKQMGIEIIKEIYKKDNFKETPILITDTASAEMIKYASNAFLATKISFINEISNICELSGADVQIVAKGMGFDGRIGNQFLQPGPGYGGSCFPKDTKALVGFAKNLGYEANLIKSVIYVNEKQKINMLTKIKTLLGKYEEMTITILGLSYKAGTDDIRESPSV